jgi:hypothetical protein
MYLSKLSMVIFDEERPYFKEDQVATVIYLTW